MKKKISEGDLVLLVKIIIKLKKIVRIGWSTQIDLSILGT